MGSESTRSTSTTIPFTTEELKVTYSLAEGQTITAADAVRILDSILNRDSAEDLTISEIEDALSVIRGSIVSTNNEIVNLKRLLAILTFELMEQGIEIQNKELNQNVKNYLKF